jgi:hypothetical protein
VTSNSDSQGVAGCDSQVARPRWLFGAASWALEPPRAGPLAAANELGEREGGISPHDLRGTLFEPLRVVELALQRGARQQTSQRRAPVVQLCCSLEQIGGNRPQQLQRTTAQLFAVALERIAWQERERLRGWLWSEHVSKCRRGMTKARSDDP